jgi:hypothetical protein
MKNPAGAQAISSRTTVNDWLAKNPSYNVDRWGQPIAFGCDICQALRFETLEEALEHRRIENRTVRSGHWMHDVTLVARRTTYVASAAAIRAAAEKPFVANKEIDECEICGSTEGLDHIQVKQAPGTHSICQNCSAMDIPRSA